MKLIDQWKAVLSKAWSIRLALLSAVLGALEVGLPFFSDIAPPKLFGSLSAAVALASAIARLVAQKELSDEPSNT